MTATTTIWLSAVVAGVMLFAPCGTAEAQEVAGREKLRAHSNEFRREVIGVTDGVYVAVGYSASNVILIQGDSGSIIVDTASNPAEAREARWRSGLSLTRRCAQSSTLTATRIIRVARPFSPATTPRTSIVINCSSRVRRTSSAAGAMAATRLV
jgi:hypothetical protein